MEYFIEGNSKELSSDMSFAAAGWLQVAKVFSS